MRESKSSGKKPIEEVQAPRARKAKLERVSRDITERKRTEEKEKKHFEQIQFLSRTAMELVEFPFEENIYQFIGEKLKELVGDCFVTINSYDKASDSLCTRAVGGLGKHTKRFIEIMGREPVGKCYPVNDEDGRRKLLTGRLVKGPEGLYELTFGEIPKGICRAIEELLGLRDIYAIGLTSEGELLGTAIVITRGAGGVKNQDIIETFIYQAGVALQRRLADEALQHSKKEWEKTFNAISDWVVLTDLKGRILRTNRTGENFTGRPLAEIAGQSCCKLVHGEDKHIPGCPLAKLLETGERASTELQVPDTDRWLMVTVDPITDEEGKLTGAVHITRDITERKKAEEKLRKSEEYYRMLTETMNDGLGQIDENGRFVYVNNKYSEIMGYSPDEIIGKHWMDLHDENAHKIIKEQLIRRRKGVAEPYDVVHTRNDGERIFIRISPQPIFDATGNFKGSLAIFTDITERKKAEEALRESEQKFRLIFENAKDAILWADMETGSIINCNRAAEVLLEREKSEIVGKHQTTIHPPEKAKYYADMFKRHIEHKTALDDQAEVITKSGTIKPVHITATVTLVNDEPIIQGIFRDITERKKAEEQLQKSQSLLNETGKMAKVGGWEFDVETLEQVWTEEVYRIHEVDSNYKPTVEAGISFYAPESRPIIANAVQKAIDNGEPFDVELQFITAKGNHRWVHAIGKAHQQGGKTIKVSGTFQDITERKKAEEKLLEYQAQLRSLASQLTLAEERERRRIATELHDQISQSLVISKMKVDRLRESASGKELNKALDEIANSLGQTITETRSLTSEIHPPLLALLGFEEAVAEWLSEQIEEKHGIAAEFEDDGLPKPLDDDIRILLFRDVRELLTNVVRHAYAHKVKVSIRKVDEQICVTVEDDGVGFDPAEVASIGLETNGFGLFSIQERLEELGGHLEIEFEPGQGAKVTITAPLKRENNAEGRKI